MIERMSNDGVDLEWKMTVMQATTTQTKGNVENHQVINDMGEGTLARDMYNCMQELFERVDEGTLNSVLAPCARKVIAH